MGQLRYAATHPTANELEQGEFVSANVVKSFIVDEAVYNPIEVVTNLVYLTKLNAGDERKILLYMTMADEALETLVEALDKINSL